MLKSKRVLVAGTTADYIEWIRQAQPERAIFLTDPEIRKNAEESIPAEEEELITRLDNYREVKKALKDHMKKWKQEITGIACFDCESMELASRLAYDLGVPYPELGAVRNSRDKYAAKQIWQNKGVPCPASALVDSFDDVTRFVLKAQNGIVLKPLCGSGSELVFKCTTLSECREAFELIRDGLDQRGTYPLFKTNLQPEHLMLAETFIPGPEYSCDFVIEKNKIHIIRITRKIKSTGKYFGTVSGYVLTKDLSRYVEFSDLESVLLKGAESLGIKRAICMVDLILKNHQAVLIEMTPRPGGDCLPYLLKEAGNIDILSLALDFAEQKPLELVDFKSFNPHIGLRIHAHKKGKLKLIDTKLLQNEECIKDIHFSKKPGHKIVMPPEDYDSWLLGHIIFQSDNNTYPESQCDYIKERIRVEIT